MTPFDTVEIDSTFYRIPSASTVDGWANKTPDGFIFSAKVPQVITNEKMLVDCDAEFKQFVDLMDVLGEKLGPLVLQFPYFNHTKFKSGGEFVRLLKSFMSKLPKDHRFAVEIRDRIWLDARFADALREHNVALHGDWGRLISNLWNSSEFIHHTKPRAFNLDRSRIDHLENAAEISK